MDGPAAQPPPPHPAELRPGGLLGWVERVGNRLPEPAVLFAMLAALVVVASGIASWTGWEVRQFELKVEQAEDPGPDGGTTATHPRLDEQGHPVVVRVYKPEPLRPRSLMTGEGVYWMLSSMIRNFTGLAALGLVFVGMLGIGLAEKLGLFGAMMRAIALGTPRQLLTPVVVFIGANASVASDAGLIILPPLAAALYLAAGRHPVAGLAAAFAGVSGGFGAGLFPTAADGFLAGEATRAAHLIDPTYGPVIITHNFYFKTASAVVVMLAGWFVTDRVVEPRLTRERRVDSRDTSVIEDLGVSPLERRGLIAAVVAMVVILGAFFALVFIPGAPLHGTGQPTLASGGLLVEVGAADVANGVVQGPAKVRLVDAPGARWSQVIVPLILVLFLVPGMIYGRIVGTLRTQRDFVDAIYHGVRSIVPVLTIAFFMGQFVNYFQYSGMDKMLAFAGGSLLIDAQLPAPLLLVLFVVIVVAGDFCINGMLAKYALLAPVFIPMFMLVGMSPELVTAGYRIGDSVANVISPLNSYMLIILVVLQKYRRDAGLGSLISLMLPYSVVFFVVWTGLLLLWMAVGADLGPGSGQSC